MGQAYLREGENNFLFSSAIFFHFLSFSQAQSRSSFTKDTSLPRSCAAAT